ncbi:MAG TPA: helix-turn-helix domain-containing protein [Stellaceae bacterium]|nr:helix-turn-helix domain-containing protein [Stellaceae bacterium]
MSEVTKLLTTPEAADLLGVSPKLLERHRIYGTGPSFVKLAAGRSGRVRYRASDLAAWIAARCRSETQKHAHAEPGASVAA